MCTISELMPGELFSWELLLSADPQKSAVEKYLDRSRIFLLKSQDGEVLGQLLLLSLEPKTAEIINLAVLEKEQGKGYGKKLIEFAVEAARKSGLDRLEIGTGNSSLGQLSLYQKCGFEISGIDKGFFVRNYSEPIWENGIQCKDMIRLSLKL